MSDGLTIVVDEADVLTALDKLGPAAERYVFGAAHVTADAIAREAKARLSRALGKYATGKTLAGIEARPSVDGKEYVVVADREPFPLLPLWLEKGTKKGKGTHANPAKPFFYISALLEEGNHLRRIEEALAHAIAETGMGD